MQGDAPVTQDGDDPTPEPGGAADDARVVQYAEVRSGGVAVQAVGDASVTVHQHHHPAIGVSWPVRLGVPPPVADRYQRRRVDDVVAGVVAAAGTRTPDDVGSVGAVVLSGLGGVGKSQVAARLAWQVWRDESVDLAMWVDARSRAAVVTAYARGARRVLRDTDPDVDDHSPEEAATGLLSWSAATDRRWLIVLDDLQDPADLRGLWPPVTPSGRVVVTTRRRDAALAREDRRVVEVGVFTEDEASAYLVAKSPGSGAPPGDADGLRALAADLGHLPLALAQAAAYLADNPALTVADYRGRLADRRRTLAQVMPEGGALPDDHRDTVSATWALSIEHADALAPRGLARPLLELISLLDPAGVPVDLFTAQAVKTHLGDPADDDVVDALGTLHRLGLVTLDPDRPDAAVLVHGLVQRAVRDDAAQGRLVDVARVVADALLEIWPFNDVESPVGPVLRANGVALHANAEAALWTGGPHPLLLRVGESLGEAGLVTAATNHFRHVHDRAWAHLGDDHRDTLAARGGLARLRLLAGDAAGAVADAERLLADQRRVLGPDHPDVAATLVTLAESRGEEGDAAAAVEGFEQLLAEQGRGRRLRDVLRRSRPVDQGATSQLHPLHLREKLAQWRARSGRLDLAEAEYERLLVDQCALMGADHPTTLRTRANLARTKAEKGDLTGAAAEFDRLLDEQRRVLGADHPHTLTTRVNLVHWRTEEGSQDGVEDEYRRLVDDHVRVLGPDHVKTLHLRSSFARWKARTGRVSEAAAEFEALHADHLRLHGPDHPDTRTAGHNLALARAGRTGAGTAADVRQVLHRQQDLLGPDHPDTLATRRELARLRAESGDLPGATAEYRALLERHLELFGPDDARTLDVRENLALRLLEADDVISASAEYALLLPRQRRLLGDDHPDVLTTRARLVHCVHEAGDTAAAAATYARLLPDQLRVLGPDHPDTFVTRAVLAQHRAGAGQAKEAVKDFRRLLADVVRALGPDHPHALTTRANLARCLAYAGKRRRAAVQFRRLLAEQRRVLGPDHPATRATAALLGQPG